MLNGAAGPRDKLNGFVITNPTLPANLDFVRKEWGQFLRVISTAYVFAKKNGATRSHTQLLREAWR